MQVMQVRVLRDQGVGEGICGRPRDRERLARDLDMVREWGDRRPGGRLGPERGRRRPLAGSRKEPLLEFDPITVEALAGPIRETEHATWPDDPGHLAEGKLGDRRV